MKISIKDAKRIREEFGLTHIVIFGVEADGTEHVATHGKTMENAREAAKAGNKLKRAIGWPEEMCRDNPVPRRCENCFFYKPDFGVHCFNGWSGDGSSGFCKLEPKHEKTTKDNVCQHFEPQ